MSTLSVCNKYNKNSSNNNTYNNNTNNDSTILLNNNNNSFGKNSNNKSKDQSISLSNITIYKPSNIQSSYSKS